MNDGTRGRMFMPTRCSFAAVIEVGPGTLLILALGLVHVDSPLAFVL